MKWMFYYKTTYLSCTLLWAVVLIQVNASISDNTFRRINPTGLTKESLSPAEGDNHFYNDIMRPLPDTKACLHFNYFKN